MHQRPPVRSITTRRSPFSSLDIQAFNNCLQTGYVLPFDRGSTSNILGDVATGEHPYHTPRHQLIPTSLGFPHTPLYSTFSPSPCAFGRPSLFKRCPYHLRPSSFALSFLDSLSLMFLTLSTVTSPKNRGDYLCTYSVFHVQLCLYPYHSPQVSRRHSSIASDSTTAPYHSRVHLCAHQRHSSILCSFTFGLI